MLASRIPVRAQKKKKTMPSATTSVPETTLLKKAATPTTASQSNSVPMEPSEPTPEFLAELAQQSAQLESATPEEIIAWGVERA